MQIHVESHPLLELAAFEIAYSASLGELASPDWLIELLRLEAEAPLQRGEDVRAAARDLLRQGGYKPTGRSKPASEYLVRAAGEAKLGSINPAVDTCNAVSLHSGLPISVVDADKLVEPLKVGLCPDGASYVFNTSGQEISVSGLLSLQDSEGPCANAVKDAQRTKTSDGTRRTLVLIWGSRTVAGRAERAAAWYRELSERLGASTGEVEQVG